MTHPPHSCQNLCSERATFGDVPRRDLEVLLVTVGVEQDTVIVILTEIFVGRQLSLAEIP